MRFEVRHQTVYRYSAPVFQEPQVYRLRPRSDAGQRLEAFSLDIDPAPDGITDLIDLDGNSTTEAWFSGTHDHLVLTATSTVETLRANPFDFLWRGPTRLPIEYPGNLEKPLALYRQAVASDDLRRLGEDAVERATGSAQQFVFWLARRIHGVCRQIVRPEGEPLPPEETLRAGEGSCRDLTVLYMAVSRLYGFATRFVSGYFYVDGAEAQELHAWAEVYLPGGGWRGFDPSHGLAVADRHIALAAAADPALAAPVTGAFRGSAQALPLEATLSITPVAT